VEPPSSISIILAGISHLEWAYRIPDAGTAQGVRREAQTIARFQIDKIISEMDLVRREEFDAVREMAILARRENDILTAKFAELEAKLAAVNVSPTSPVVPLKGNKPVNAAKSSSKTENKTARPSA
jgi:BMFP domain-containing protein YqiC